MPSGYFKGAGGVIFELDLPLSENMQAQVKAGTLFPVLEQVTAKVVHVEKVRDGDDVPTVKLVPSTANTAATDVPAGSANAVMEWVGDDRVRAQRALDVENAADKPRSGLVAKLTALVNAE
jgi:hypothetical protein